MATQVAIQQPARLAKERQALKAVLDSPRFKKNPRLTNLLEYICQKYFEGDTEGIKEYSIAADVFHRPETFDQTTDSIVRVEVYRLRKKLRAFYDAEGADQPIEIVVATGHYLPEFVDRVARHRLPAKEEEEAGSKTTSETLVSDNRAPQPVNRTFDIVKHLLLPVAVILVATILWRSTSQHSHSRALPVLTPASASTPALQADTEIRIRCGYDKTIFKDQQGNVWTGDRYYSGGVATELKDQYIARTREPKLYLTSRSGTSFTYKIPLPPGTYEMKLYFAETTYSPASTLGGGENSRVFNVQLNGKPLLSQFDIVADAGANTADVRVFKDVHPDSEGNVQLDFAGVLGVPMISAIEIVPGTPHLQRPLRMVAQNSYFVDKTGTLWEPDTAFSGGRLASDNVVVEGTSEPGLYSGERYGNFSYALPADKGSFTLTLYFAEKYWDAGPSKTGGVGSRVFDILCNGVALARDLDILKEVGPHHAFKKTFHGLRPNAQGKLIVSLVPNVNYASVDAVELVEEMP